MKHISLTLAACLVGTVALAGETAPKEVVYDEYGAVETSLSGVAVMPQVVRCWLATSPKETVWPAISERAGRCAVPRRDRPVA